MPDNQQLPKPPAPSIPTPPSAPSGGAVPSRPTTPPSPSPLAPPPSPLRPESPNQPTVTPMSTPVVSKPVSPPPASPMSQAPSSNPVPPSVRPATTPTPPAMPQSNQEPLPAKAPMPSVQPSTMPTQTSSLPPKPPMSPPPMSQPNPNPAPPRPPMSSPPPPPPSHSAPRPPVGNAPVPPPPMPAVSAASNSGRTPPPAIPASTSASGTVPRGGGNPLLKIIAMVVVVLVLGIGGYAGYQLFMNQDSPNSSGTGGPVELTYWGLWESEAVMQPIIEEYQTANPNVKITYKPNSKTEYSGRLRNALASDSGPDIFRMHNTWTYMLQNHLSALPSEIYPPEQYQQDFFPIAYQNLRLNDQIVAIPLMIDGLALYYNVDLFARAGIEPPTTWDTFQDAAQRLTVVDQNRQMQIGGAAMGYTGNIEHWPDIVAVLMYQNRADPTYPSDQVAYDAVAFYSLFAYRYNTWSLDMPPATEAFATGRLAMMFGPSWEVFNIQQLAKDKGTTVNFRIIPIPQLPETNVTWASYWVEGVNNKSKNQAEAWKFLKYLSSAETMQKLFDAQSKEREFGEIPSRPALAKQYENHPYMGAYIIQAPAARTHAFTSSTSDDNGINGRIVKYYQEALDKTARGTAPQSALQTTGPGIKEVFRDYGLNL